MSNVRLVSLFKKGKRKKKGPEVGGEREGGGREDDSVKQPSEEERGGGVRRGEEARGEAHLSSPRAAMLISQGACWHASRSGR